MKPYSLAVAFLLFINLFAVAQQPDTIYYDRDWNVTALKVNMQYYRVITKQNGLFMVQDHYKNGQLQMIGSYSSLNPEVQEGAFKYYDEKGQLDIERSYVANQLDGDYKRYYPNGQIHWQIHYIKGINDGVFMVWYQNGKVRRHDEYKNGVLTSSQCFTADGKDTVAYPYEVRPSFVGGADSLQKYLDDSIVYITDGKDSMVLVALRFVVNEKGLIHDIKVMQGNNSGYEQLFMDAVKHMPPWIPGQQDGVAVPMPVTLAMRFGGKQQ